MSRKMFNKSRPARDALNKAGGIMDSSPELMQEVQGYPVQGVQNFAKGMSVFTDPTSPFYRPSTANRVSSRDDISDIRIPGGGTNRGIRSIYAEEGPNDGTKLAYLRDTLRMRQDPEYIKKYGDGVVPEINFKTGERMGGEAYDYFTQPRRTARLAGMMPDLEYDERGMPTGFDVEGNINLDTARRAYISDVENPADLSQRGIASQLATDKAAIAEFQAANPNEYVPLTQSEIIDKQSANPALLNVEGSEGFVPKMDNEAALTIMGQTGVDYNIALKMAQANAEKKAETDYLAKIAEDEKAMANRERVMGDMDPGKGSKSVEEQMKNEIQNVVKNGTPEQKRSSLKELMAQFTNNAPKYEGMNKGLAIAKIGFAIAAGQSSNAMTNIANGLSQGADAFIEDAAKRDAFKRQVDLSALQYGLGEKSKDRTQDRAIASEDRAEARIRERALIGQTKFTAGSDGVTYKGRFYAPFTTVAVDKTDISNNKLPLGLQEPSVINALETRKAASIKTAQTLIQNNTLKPEQAISQQEKYAKAVDDAIRSERGLHAVQDVMIQVADGVSGLGNAGKDLVAKGTRMFKDIVPGLKNLKDDSSKIELVKSSFRRLLQDVVPLTLATSQSANSISNRDVELLIRAYFGDNALEPGSLTFVALDEKTILKNLSTIAEIMQNEQKSSFTQMTRIEAGMAPLFQAGTTTSASNLLKFDQERLGDLVGKRSVGASSGFSRGDDGKIRFNEE